MVTAPAEMNMTSASFSCHSATPEPSRCAIMNRRFPSVATTSLATFCASSFCPSALPFAAISADFHTCTPVPPPCAEIPNAAMTATTIRIIRVLLQVKLALKDSVLLENGHIFRIDDQDGRI